MSIERNSKHSITAEVLEHATLQKIISVETGMKQVVLIVEVQTNDKITKCLYHPEKGVALDIDPRIPRPQELYRDVAFHRIDNLLGWNITAPVIPWKLKDGDVGTLRPYWEKIHKMEIYHFTRENLIKNKYFWIKAAILDYICGVVDRTPNDILILENSNPETTVIVDSGLSFVPEENIVNQSSVIRNALISESIPQNLLDDLRHAVPQIYSQISQFVDQKSMSYVLTRIQNILEQKIII